MFCATGLLRQTPGPSQALRAPPHLLIQGLQDKLILGTSGEARCRHVKELDNRTVNPELKHSPFLQFLISPNRIP